MSLINPNYPSAAVGIRRESVSAVALQKQGRVFGLRSAATVGLREGVLQPDFFAENLNDPDEILAAIRDAVASAGLSSEKKWSVSLPAEAARMSVLTLDTAPKTKAERADVLNWKAERAFGAAPAEMRLAVQPLSPDEKGRMRFFVIAMRLETLTEYEDLFENLGWRVGLIVPHHFSEVNWLNFAENNGGDALMVSSQADGFTAILMRGSEPAVVRSVICEVEEREDELYRLLLFYRDRFEAENSRQSLQKLLLIGENFPVETVHIISQETLGYYPQVLDSKDVGLFLPNEVRFEDIAAPAGLASLAWR